MANNVVGSNLKVPRVTQPKTVSLKQLSMMDTGNQPELQDFAPDIEASAPVVNTPSSMNAAAYAAALSPEGTSGQEMIDSYRQALSEDSLEGQSQTATNLFSQAKQSALQQNVDPLMNILSNPNISDEQKRKAVGQVYDQNSAIYSPENILSTKALGTPTVGTPNKEEDDVRYSISAGTQQMNEVKRQIQQVYNGAQSAVQPDLKDKIFNFGMSLIPFTNQYMLSKIRADQTGAPVSAFVKTFIGGLGNSQEYLRDQIASLPPDQQLSAASHLADIINTHSNILMSGTNDYARRQFLQSTIGGEGYSSKDQLVDNLSSWSDLLFAGYSGAKSLGSLAKVAKAGAKEADVASAFQKDFESNYAAEKQGQISGPTDQADLPDNVVPTPPYTPQNKNSLGQFKRSREIQVYDSSSGVPYQKMPDENVLSSAIRDAIRSRVQPVSVFQNLKDTNIDMARDAFESMTLDQSGEAAQALAGTDRTDALASAMMPEVVHVDGSVANKIAAPDAIAQTRDAVPAEIVDFVKHDGLTQYLDSEKAAARAWKVNQFQEAIGMTPRAEMFQLMPDLTKFTDTPQGFSFRGVYGPQKNGFVDAQDALDTAKFALRNTGIDESKLGLLRRDGPNYVPADLSEEAGKKGDYLVTVDHDYIIQDQDVTKAEGWQPLQVKLNFFDRWTPLGGTQGTFSNILLDPQSMLDKVVVQPSVVGIDRAAAIEKSLLRQVEDFAKTWKGLSPAQQTVGLNEIHEANLLSRDYDFTRLAASGASAETIDALRKFKTYWDGVWHLKNKYFAKQLDKAGYEEFVHAQSNTNLPVRRVGKASVSGGVNVYDAATDTIKNLRPNEIDNLYKNGGGVAKLRQPILTQGGDVGEYVAHTNSAADGYLRSFHANSQVLNYRPGYYGIDYKDPFHIIEKVKDARGNVAYEHSIATAKDTKAAQTMVNRMNAQGTNEFYFRKDTRLNNESRFEHEFDINQAQGMSSFRRRGKLLEDTTSPTTNLSNAHVRNPIETMVGQAVPLSKKVAMQDVIDTQKQRIIQQWGHFMPKGEFGQPLIPTDLRKVKYRGGINQNQSDVADARTSVGYVNYLEHNYVNLVDDGMKAIFHNLADVIGKIGGGKAEQLTRELADKSLTRGLRSTSYYAYLGLAPLRQLLVQGHQAVLLAALNPTWVASKAAFAQPAYLALRTLGMDTSHWATSGLAKAAWGDVSKSEAVFKQFQRTGLGAAVDHQNMISGAVNDLAANMVANSRNNLVSNALRVPRTVATVSRKIGFDAGEFYNSAMSWLAHRDLAEKQGLNVLSDDVADKVAGAARNYTGNMNAAGDLASNRNALSLVFQYTQNTQKMLLNLTTNRAIPWQLKVKMGVLGAMLFGTGSTIFLSGKLNSVQNPDAREALQYGLEGWFLNKTLSLSTGQRSEIDWSGLSPYNAYGTLDMIHGLFTTNIGEIIANSPSLSMFFGGNSRVTNAVRDMAKYFNLIDDYQEPTKFLTVAKDFAKISSGMSGYFKAAYLMKTRQKISAYGTVTDDNVDSVNAIGAILGFPTEDESTMAYLNQHNIQNKKDLEDDFNQFYKYAKQHYSDPDLSGSELEYTQKMLTEFYRVHGNNNPTLQRLMNDKLRQDLSNGDASMYNMVMRNCPLYSKGDCMNLIDATPFDNDKDKQNLKSLLTLGEQFQEKPYDEKDNK